MKILIVDGYLGGSHLYWAQSLQKYSRFDIQIIGLEARHWKWRMHGSAITLINQIENISQYDLFLVTDMVDLALFKSLNKVAHKPHLLYFHENQFAYPKSKLSNEVENLSYQFMNYSSALVADHVIFNSDFNKQSFSLGSLDLINTMPDYKNIQMIEAIQKKSIVLPIGIEFELINKNKKEVANGEPHILWNHRWDHDKNIEEFLQSMIQLKKEGFSFKLNLLGKRSPAHYELYRKMLSELSENILIHEQVENKDHYYQILWSSDVVPVTSYHDFFGISVLEAIACQCHPILPNRQVYPERIPHSLRDQYLYKDNFYEKLKSMIVNGWQLPLPTRLTEELQNYRWQDLVNRYDNFFESVL